MSGKLLSGCLSAAIFHNSSCGLPSFGLSSLGWAPLTRITISKAPFKFFRTLEEIITLNNYIDLRE